MKLRLFEAQAPTKNDFKDPKNFELANKGKVEDVLKSQTYPEDKRKALDLSICKYLPNLQPMIDDNNTMNLLMGWYEAFRTINPQINPFYNYIRYLNKNFNNLNVVPTYQTLAILNNKYHDNLIRDRDLIDNSRSALLNNPEFYKATPEAQDYYLDIYAFFNDDDKLNQLMDKAKEVYSDGKNVEGVKLGGDNNAYQFVDPSKPNFKPLPDLILFVDGNPNGKLRPANVIEKITKELSMRLGEVGNTTTQNRPKEDKPNDTIEQRFKNLNLTKDQQKAIKKLLLNLTPAQQNELLSYLYGRSDI